MKRIGFEVLQSVNGEPVLVPKQGYLIADGYACYKTKGKRGFWHIIHLESGCSINGLFFEPRTLAEVEDFIKNGLADRIAGLDEASIAKYTELFNYVKEKNNGKKENSSI